MNAPVQPLAESPRGEPRESAVLLLAPIGQDAALSEALLRRFNIAVTVCDSVQTIIDRLASGEGPVVVAVEALDPVQAEKLLEVLQRQPAWADPPLILIAGRSMAQPWIKPLLARQNTTLLHRPLKVPSFVSIVRAAIESRRRQCEVRDLIVQLEDRAYQLQRLALQLTQTEERERQRISQILHDDLQQVLAGARFHVAMLPRHAREGNLDSAVARLSQLLEQAIEQSRNLSHELSPPTLGQHGLAAALEWLAARMESRHGLQVELDLQDNVQVSDPRASAFVYRCAQELLFNVVKHANVTRATLRLEADQENLTLRVEDQGAGFDPASRSRDTSSSGLGLLSIRERANLLGGRLTVASVPGKGSIFTLIMPREQKRTSSTDVILRGCRNDDPSEDQPVQSARKLRIVLADDHGVLRSGLRSLLEEQPDIQIVAEAANGVEAVALAEQHQPDVVLMDVSMPMMDGIEATRQIKARPIRTRVIGLSMFDDEATGARMREAGAECCLSKNGRSEDLINAVLELRSKSA